MGTQYYCKNEQRRQAVRNHGTLNGIDYLEVLDLDAPAGIPRQRTLLVRCLKPVPALTANNVRIEGGVRITPVKVLWAFPATAMPDPPVTAQEQAFFSSLPEPDHLLVVRTDSDGDFSAYRLSLARSPTDSNPPTGFDPQLSEIDFSFKVECPSDFDCKPVPVCPPDRLAEPLIDYLAKDYASFRRLMLDRLAVIMPDWKDRNPADLGITLVEVLAYAADHLSYYQDAVATEAYLGTARRRASLRRHARLLDYPMHEGCNARAWVTFRVDAAADGALLPGPAPDTGRPGTLLLTRYGQADAVLPPEKLAEAVDGGAVFFETMHDLTLRVAHKEIHFYTWSDRECCLPAGATKATLVGPLPDLSPGDLLLFEEVLGPQTGRAEDADPMRRHVLRLTEVQPDEDPLDSTQVVHVAWNATDAPPFPLCISARTDEKHGAEYIQHVTVARGNVVLVDHGLTPRVGRGIDPLQPAEESIGTAQAHRPFRPSLGHRPLTHAVPLPEDHRERPATELLRYRPQNAVPNIRLAETNGGEIWRPKRDLLSSDRFAAEFMVEMEDDGRAHLRFGDGVLGKRPAGSTHFTATYRVGHGPLGNVGADAITHVVTAQSGIAGVRNPLPAYGGTDAEPIDHARLSAPQAFRTQERAVTEEDYAEVARRHPEVQKAMATRRWTGSWPTMFVTVDRMGGLPVDAEFEAKLRGFLERFRLAGHDLEIDGPRFVPLDITLTVCVTPDSVQSAVKTALLETFSSVDLSDGRRGFFHPDNWTFGQSVFLSQVVSSAMQVPGIQSVDVDDTPPKPNRFRRLGQLSRNEVAKGRIEFDRLEIARLYNDPNAPEHGKIEFIMQGGL